MAPVRAGANVRPSKGMTAEDPMGRRSHQTADATLISEADLIGLLAEHARWRRLSARLEAIADALPAVPDLIERAALRAQLREAFPDTGSAPAAWLGRLFQQERHEPEVARLLDRLTEWRVTLFVQAQDLSEATENDTPSDVLGYMLRNVFSGCSELSALEVLALLLVVPQRLTPGARALLLGRLD